MQVKLLVVNGRPHGKKLVFPAGSYIFGRGSECHVRPNSDLVSRQHCQLTVAGEKAHIRDLNSRNGTLINGEAVVGEKELAEGDQFQVGPLLFEVHFLPGSSGEILGQAGVATLPESVQTQNSNSDVPPNAVTVPIEEVKSSVNA